MPGDDLVPCPQWEATRAVTIDAPPLEVWPWVAQMGYGRGGWYGWNPLEREDTGVSRLLELSPPRVGDVWLDGPGCDETKGAFTVKAVEPPQTLVLYSMRDPMTGRELDPGKKPRLFIDMAWAFHIDQIAPRKSRLLGRVRIRAPSWSVSILDDTIVGDVNDNYLWGSDGNDALQGEDGDDTLDGTVGADTLDGGDGTTRA